MGTLNLISSTAYDLEGNVTAATRRDTSSPATRPDSGKAYETWSYTPRNLRQAHVAAAGDTSISATESWTYNLDRTQDVHTDFRGNEWTTMWSPCCANRVTVQLDPLNAAETRQYDGFGSVTHTQTVTETGTSTVYRDMTTRYDERHRPKARTVWLVAGDTSCSGGTAGCCCANPPIYGGGGVGRPGRHERHCRRPDHGWLYDENLSLTGSGLMAGVQVGSMKSSGSITVSIAGLVGQVNTALSESGQSTVLRLRRGRHRGGATQSRG